MSQADGPVAELESKEDQGDHLSWNPCAPDQLRVFSVNRLVEILSSLNLNLGKRQNFFYERRFSHIIITASFLDRRSILVIFCLFIASDTVFTFSSSPKRRIISHYSFFKSFTVSIVHESRHPWLYKSPSILIHSYWLSMVVDFSDIFIIFVLIIFPKQLKEGIR